MAKKMLLPLPFFLDFCLSVSVFKSGASFFCLCVRSIPIGIAKVFLIVILRRERERERDGEREKYKKIVKNFLVFIFWKWKLKRILTLILGIDFNS